MTRAGGWLRLLLLASLLAWPRLGAAPAGTPTPSAWRADDGFPALAARPIQHLRLLLPSLGRGASAHRTVAHALPSLPPRSLGGRIVPGDAGSTLEFRAAVHGAGSPRFPTGPPATLPIA
jgi:hypothetical protein